MKYLKYDDLHNGSIIDYEGEKYELIECAGESLTYIDYADDESGKGERIDRSAMVYIKQRWKVNVLPNDRFGKPFTTHRYIKAYYCTYGELLKEQQRIYTAWEVKSNRDEDEEGLSENFIW